MHRTPLYTLGYGESQRYYRSVIGRAHPLAAGLVAVLGANNVLQDDDGIGPYRGNRSPFPEIDPGVVVMPGNADEIAKVLQLANNHLNPVIVRGNGFSMTGFVNGAAHRAIVLDTRRLDRVLEVDEENMTVTAEAGVIMSELEAHVAARGFEVQTVGVPPQFVTLGGVLSGVVGGGLPRDTSIGTTGRQLVGLKVVLPDGSLVSTNAGGGNVNRTASSIAGGDGPFITGLFIGDGGSLGVKVEATLQITPPASHGASAQWLLEDFDAVWRALRQLAEIREVPYTGIGVAEGPPWAVTYTARASNQDLLASNVRGIEAVLKECGGRPDRPGVSAIPTREWFVSVDRAIVAFIFGRADFREAFSRVRSVLDERIRERHLAELGIAVRAFIYPHTRHAMFASLSILFDRAKPDGRTNAVALATEAYDLAIGLGGYLEAQQGQASRIIAQAWSPSYRRLFLALKTAVDPNRILNPGLWGVD